MNLVKKFMIKIQNLKLVILVEYRNNIKNIKTFLQKGYTRNWSDEDFVIKIVKNTVPWAYVINDLNGE